MLSSTELERLRTTKDLKVEGYSRKRLKKVDGALQKRNLIRNHEYFEAKKWISVVNLDPSSTDERTGSQDGGERRTEIDFLHCKKCSVESSQTQTLTDFFYRPNYKLFESKGSSPFSSHFNQRCFKYPTNSLFPSKNEKLLRTQMIDKFTPKILKTFLSAIFYLILVLLIFFEVGNLHKVGAYASPLNLHINESSSTTTLLDRTFPNSKLTSYQSNDQVLSVDQWSERLFRRDLNTNLRHPHKKVKHKIRKEERRRNHHHQHQQQTPQYDHSRQSINRNCKEHDITTRVYLSDFVFEGVARSRSPRQDPLGRYDVTFYIKKILKENNSKNPHLSPSRPNQIRLHFGEKKYQANRMLIEKSKVKISGFKANDLPNRSRSSENVHCIVYNAQTQNDLVRANIRTGGKYIVIAKQVGPMNFSALGEPIKSNVKNNRSVRSVLCLNCATVPVIKGLKNVQQKISQELRLTCRTYGSPVPVITWYKDGIQIIPTPKLKLNITFYKRKSTIEIKHIKKEDGGKYECRAENLLGSNSSFAYVNVTDDESSTQTPWPLHGEECEVNAFCLNGGTCTFFSSLGELSCSCADGYNGQRCENKDVSTRGSTSYFCGFNIGYSQYYC